jgi:hypothetical protein
MKSIIYTFVLLFALSNWANAQRIYCSIKPITGKKDIVSVEIPKGWIQDHKENSRIHANQALVLEGESLHKNSGYIFIQAIAVEEGKSIEEIIAHEKLMYATNTVTVKETAPITVEAKRATINASTVQVNGSADGEQLVAFIPSKNSVLVVTLCSDNKNFITQQTAAFETLVGSYQLNPIINPPSYAEVQID